MNTYTHHRYSVLAIAAALFLSACPPADDDPVDGGSDAGDTDASSDAAPPGDVADMGGDRFYEEDGDIPDCRAACENVRPDDAMVFDTAEWTGVRGRIDPETEEPFGDLDLVALQAPVRSKVTVTVRALGPDLQPRVYVNEGSLGVNTGRTSTAGGEASVEFVFPDADGPMYVNVGHLGNFMGGEDGGEGYEWEMTWDVESNAETDLGDLSEGTLTLAEATISQSGQMHYYRFTADSSQTPQVAATLAPSASADFLLGVIAFTSTNGRAVYNGFNCREMGTELVDWTGPAESNGTEYLFAVVNCNSSGSPSHEYSLEVTAQ